MKTVRGTRAQDAGVPRNRDRRTLRWSLMAVAITLSLAFAVSSGSSQEPLTVKCEDFTAPRECTPVDQWGFCVNNAMDDYEDCKEGANFLRRAGCAIVYDVNFWACTIALPVSAVFN